MNEDQPFSSVIKEIEAQENDINEFISYMRSLKIESPKPEETVFCGAGDSLAAAIFTERLMNFKPRAFDPYDIVLYPEVGRDKKVFFVSVSGKTKANIQAARILHRRAKERIAITANPESELAKNCDDVIELKYTRGEVLTPGTNSFTSSLIACSMLFKNIPKLDVQSMIESGKAWCAEIAETQRRYHFIGSGSFYAIALYGAAKIFEFLGEGASYQLTEEFSHLNLFSLGRKQENAVVILRYGDDDQRAKDLDALLTQIGVTSIFLPSPAQKEHVVHRAISYTIHLQLLALNIALKKGLKKPAFLENNDLLSVSNKMIYYQ